MPALPEDIPMLRQMGYTDEQIAAINPIRPQESQLATIGKTLRAHAGGTIGGGAGALGGAELGATIGAPGGPIGIAAGGIIGGTIGALGGGAAGQGIQNAIGGETQQGWEQQAQASAEQNPYTALGTDIVSSALASGGKPSLNALTAAKGLIGKGAMSPAAKEALVHTIMNAGVNPAINTGIGLATGQGLPSGTELGAQVAGGALFSGQAKWAERLMNRGKVKNEPAAEVTSSSSGIRPEQQAAEPSTDVNDIVSQFNNKNPNGEYELGNKSISKLFKSKLDSIQPVPSNDIDPVERERILTIRDRALKMDPDKKRDFLHRESLGKADDDLQALLTGNQVTHNLRLEDNEMKANQEDEIEQYARTLQHGDEVEIHSDEDEPLKGTVVDNGQTSVKVLDQSGTVHEIPHDELDKLPSSEKVSEAFMKSWNKLSDEAFIEQNKIPLAKLLTDKKAGNVNAVKNILREDMPNLSDEHAQRLLTISKNYANQIKGSVEDVRSQTPSATPPVAEGESGGLQQSAGDTSSKETKTNQKVNPKLPDWVNEHMIAQGKNPSRMFNEQDLSNPSVREALLNDPTLTKEQKDQILSETFGKTKVTKQNPPVVNPLTGNKSWVDNMHGVLDKMKSNQSPDQLHAFGLLPKVWDTGLEMAKGIITAGGKIHEAVEAFVNYLKQNSPSFNEDAVRRYVHQSLTDGDRAFSTNAADLIRDGKLGIKPNTSGAFHGTQLLGTIFNKLSPTEQEMYKSQGVIEHFQNRYISKDDAIKWFEEHTPKVEVKKFGEGALSPERREYNALYHKFDSLHDPHDSSYNWTPEQQADRQRLMELKKTLDKESVKDIPSAHWSFVAPKAEHDMPGYVEIAVVKPLKIGAYTKDKTVGNMRTTSAAERGEQFPSSHGFPPNTLGFLRGYMETTPAGEKVFHVIEVQSDWAQRLRQEVADHKVDINSVADKVVPYEFEGEHQGYYVKQYGGETVFPTKEAAIKDYVDKHYPESRITEHKLQDPLLPHYERLALKAAIEHARQEGATKIAISDAETAMISEEHDKDIYQARKYVDRANYQAKEYFMKDEDRLDFDKPKAPQVLLEKLTKAYEEHGAKFELTSDGKQIIMTRAPFEGGMGMHYDKSLPKIAEELTGSKGERASFGEHAKTLVPSTSFAGLANPVLHNSKVYDNYFEADKAARNFDAPFKVAPVDVDGGYKLAMYPDDYIHYKKIANELGFTRDSDYRKNLIFRNPDGTPKTDVTARVYDIGKVPESKPALFGKRFSIADKLDSLKIDTNGQLHAFGIIPAVWNTAIDMAKVAIKAGESIHAAISKAIEHIKANHNAPVNEQAIRSHLESKLGESNKTTGTPPEKSLGITRSVTDTVRAKGGENNKLVADRAHQTLNHESELRGHFANGAVQAGEGLSKEQRDKLRDIIVQEQSTGNRYVGPMDIDIRPAYIKLRGLLHELGVLRLKEGLPVVQPVTKNGKTVYVTRSLKQMENYWPSMMRQSVADDYRQGRNVEANNKIMYDHLVNNNGLTPKEATTRLRQFNDAMKASMGDTPEQNLAWFNANRKAMGESLPKEFQEPNPIRGLQRYFNRASTDLAHYKFMEKDHDILAAQGIKKDAWGNRVKSDIKPVNGNDSDIQALSNQWKRSMTHDQLERGISSLITTAFTSSPALESHKIMSSIPGAMTQAPDGTTAIHALIHGLTNLQSGYTKAVENGVVKLDARSGIDMLTGGQNAAERMQGLGKIIRQISSIGGLTTKLNAGLMQAMGEVIVPANINRAKAGDMTALQRMRNLDPSFDPKRTYSPDEMSKLASQFATALHGTGDIRSLPKWMLNDSELSGFFTLAHWSTARTNAFMKDVYTPLRQGNVQPLLIAAMGSALGGYAIKLLREEITGRKNPIPSLTEIANSEQGLEGNKGLLAYNLMASLQYAGFGGLLGQVAKYPFDIAHKNNPQSMSFPLDEVGSDVIEHISKMTSAAATDPNFNWADAIGDFTMHVLSSNIQLARIAMNQGINHGLITGYQADKKLLGDKLQQLRRFDQVQGLPYADVDAASNPYMNIEAKRFHMEQDPQKAIAMLPGMISNIVNAYHDNPDVMKNKLDALKHASYDTFPSMESMPLQFAKYIGYLQRVEGPEEAEKALRDYLSHKALNSVKDSVIP